MSDLGTARDRVDELFSGIGRRGLVSLPGTRRQVWWTGRVAIGLRFEGLYARAAATGAERWIQQQLLDDPPAER